MKAGVLRNRRMVVDEVAEPVAGSRHVLCEVKSCGICGSDLHTIAFGDVLVRAFNDRPASEPGDEVGYSALDFGRDVVLGHEFCAEVIELGADVDNASVGDLMVSVPAVIDAAGGHGLGFSNLYPGGFAQRMVLSTDIALKVPNGLPHHLAALTEPATVGEHTVDLAAISPGQGALVLGAGPVGVMIVASLARRGVAPIVVSEPAVGRRAMATRAGAHVVVDPTTDDPIAVWHATAERRQPLTIFEAVGVPGMLDAAIRMAPPWSRLVVAGICCEADTIFPARAFRSSLNIQFVGMYSPADFAATLRLLAEGALDIEAIATGAVGLDGLPTACAHLATPHDHAKVLVQPGLRSSDIVRLGG